MRPTQKLKNLISEEIKAVRKEQVLNEKRVAFFEAFANSPVDSFSELEKIEVVRYMLAEEILTEEMLAEENLDEYVGALARGAATLGKAGYKAATGLASKYAPMVRQTSAAGKAVKPGQFASTTGLGKAYEKLRKSALASFFFGKAGGATRVGKGWLPQFKQLSPRSPYAVPTGLAALLGIPAAAAAGLLDGSQEPTPEQAEKIRKAVASEAGGGGAAAGGGGGADVPADWARFAGQSDAHAAMARKWIEANSAGALQEAALPSDDSYNAFQAWYNSTKNEIGGHFGPEKASELIDQATAGATPEAPAPEVAPEPSGEATGQPVPTNAPIDPLPPTAPAATSASPIQGVLDKQTAAYSAKLQDIINKYEAMGPEQAIRKSELFKVHPELQKDFKFGSGGARPTVTSGEVVAAAKNAMAKLKASIEKAQKQAGKSAARASKRQGRIAGVQSESTINESVYNRWQTLIKN